MTEFTFTLDFNAWGVFDRVSVDEDLRQLLRHLEDRTVKIEFAQVLQNS